MKLWMTAFMALFHAQATSTPPKKMIGLLEPGRPVRVLLLRDQSSIQVSSLLNALYYKHDSFGYWVDIARQAVISTKTLDGEPRITLGTNILKKGSIYLRGGTRPLDKISVGGVIYRGAIKITLSGSKLLVVNILPLEDYVKGTLAAEMHGTWAIEALKAQAIASRTYALYMIQHPKNALYDLEKSIQDQVYAGVEVESPKITRAVDDTKGVILMHNNAPIKAYFHARCGGMTETEKDVWKTNGNLAKTRVPCAYCQKNQQSWQTTLSLNEISKKVGLPQEKAPVKILSVDRSPSGRIASLTLTNGPLKKAFNADTFRNLLGFSRLKSTRFDWRILESQIEFRGTGAGHGVGMCQWGAHHLARSGKSHSEILTHYYPDAQLGRPH